MYLKVLEEHFLLLLVVAIGLFGCFYLATIFPASFLLDMYWEEPIDAEDIERLDYNHFMIVGLPAGEGIQVLETKEQFDSIRLKDHYEFYTFETDSIIPLNVFQMKSGTDIANETYRVGGRYQRNTGKQWPTYSHNIWEILRRRNIYNRYYLVKLPDGNYVVAYLDDGYYLKYLLDRKVQLPVGYVTFFQSYEKKELQWEMEKYGLDEDHYLVMFSQTRYEQNKGSYTSVQIAVYLCAMVIYFGTVIIVQVAREKKKGKAKNEARN